MKKIGKFLAFAAFVGAAVAAGIVLYNKFKDKFASTDEDIYEFDDFDGDFDDIDTERGYTALNTETPADVAEAVQVEEAEAVEA